MRKVKYYSSLIIFCIAWLLISELYVLHMENFQSEFPYMTFYRPKQSSPDIMLEDIKDSANKYKLKIFLVQQKINNLSSKTINIYSTADIDKNLITKSFVSAGKYNSLFLGRGEVCYKDWEQIENIDDFSTYYYIGEKKNAIELKKELVDKYGGKFPQPGYVTLDYEQNVIIIWGVSFSFLVLLSIYQNLLEKKLIAVRILMGESALQIVLKNFLLDILIYGFELILSQLFIGIYGNTFISAESSYIAFLIFIGVNFLLYIPYLKIDFQRSLKNAPGKGILLFSYGYKMFIICIFIVLASECVKLVFSGVDYYNQRNFFALYKDYAYSKIELDDGEETNRMRFEFYNSMLKAGKAITLNQIESYSNSERYIYADSGAVSYLEEKIPQLSDKILDNKIYFLLPQGERINDVKETWESYYRGEYDSETIYYSPKEKIISTFRPDSISINSSREKTPIIILNNSESNSIDFMNPYLIDNAMYDISLQEWTFFLNENQIDKNLSCLTNVYENYQIYWKQNQRLLILGAGVLILLLLLESIITSAILHYEYQMNAVEIVIKKVVGYSFLNRYKKIIFITISGDVMGIILSIILLFPSKSLGYTFFCAIILCVLEMSVLIRKTILLESQHVNKILKGGGL